MTLTDAERVGSGRSAAVPAVLDVLVLAGGPSAEREVSLGSGAAVAAALTRLGHRATVCDIRPEDLSALDRPADFVFIALHGEFGEDGTVQALLESRGLRYGGSGCVASRVAMNKALSKQRFEHAGIPTPEYEVVGREGLRGLSGRMVLPVVVKPVASGSSVDTTIARTPEALLSAATAVIERHGDALVERYVSGRELTVGILGDTALPVCEIRTKREFYDYQAKYVDDDTEYRFEIDLPAALLERVRRIGLAAHRTLGCSVFSRVDLMVDAERMEPTVLEVNTIPGFTSHSLLPKAAARVGISFEELCRRIVEMSWTLER